jgi:hypothetical protein
MGITYNPRIVTDGLVLCLDAANLKSYGDNTENLLSTSIRTTDGNGATSGSGWTLTANNAASPDGTTTATLLTQTSSLSNSGILWLGGGNSAGQVMSIFCKPVSGNAVLQGQTGNGDGWTANLSTNVFTDTSGGRHANGGVDVYSDGWKRVIIPMFSIPPFSGAGSYSGGDFYLTLQGAGSVLLWGWQRENGSTANPYYSTTGTAKTRGTTWTDISGRGNTGTLTNGPTYSSANGGSLSFDGSNQTVQRSSSTINFSGGSMEVWAYFNNFNGNQGVFSMSTPPTYINFYIPTSRYMRWEVIGTTGNAYSTISSTYVLLTNTWYHIVGTFGSSTTNLYINGDLNNTQGSYTNVPSNFTSSIVLGEYAGYLNGKISNAKIYNRALTAAEVTQNFNALKSRYI